MSTPQELLKEVKEYFQYIPDVESESSEDFFKITRKQIEDLEIPSEEKVKYDIEDDYLVQVLVKDILTVLDENELIKVEKNIAFGKINNTKINAMCIKDDGNYVIAVNVGLLLLLHKHGKLSVASMNPENVIFCNRAAPKDINSGTYKKWADELIENYKKYNSPLGAMIKLNQEATVSHYIALDLKELFVVCHELGHFFNGDLENEDNLIKLINTDWNVCVDNKNHEIEYKADLTGFDILSKVAKKKYGLDKKDLILYVAVLFDIFAMIDANAYDSHPSPIDRTYNILKHNFNVKIADDYLKTYNKELSIIDFFNSINCC